MLSATNRLLLFGAVLFVMPYAEAASATPAFGNCPVIDFSPLFQSTSAAKDTLLFISVGAGRIMWDLRVPKMDVSANGLAISGKIADRYAVTGIPDDQVITFRADFHVRASAHRGVPEDPGSFATAGLDFGETGSNIMSISASSGGTTAVDQIVSMYLTHGPSDIFEIEWDPRVNSNEGTGEVIGDLSFAELPAGSSILSCYGFRYDSPVPTQTSTWGRLKALWR